MWDDDVDTVGLGTVQSFIFGGVLTRLYILCRHTEENHRYGFLPNSCTCKHAIDAQGTFHRYSNSVQPFYQLPVSALPPSDNQTEFVHRRILYLDCSRSIQPCIIPGR